MEFLYELESTELDDDFSQEVMDGFDQHVFICQQEFETRVRDTLEKFGQVHLQDDFGEEVGVARLELSHVEYSEDGEPDSAIISVRLLKREPIAPAAVNPGFRSMWLCDLSQATGVPHDTLRLALNEGRLEGRKEGGRWRSSVALVEKALNEGRMRRPKGESNEQYL